MTPDDALQVLGECLRRIAPEVDLDEAEHDEPMLEELDLDSMDFLSLVGELHERAGIDVPESDYDRLGTISSSVDYLVQRSAGA